MEAIRLALLTLVCWQTSSGSQQTCPRGHRLQMSTDGLDVCIQCEDGVSFMPAESHTNKNCYNCTQIEHPDLEVLAAKCNISHDSEILCQQGHYRYKARNSREKDICKKCTQCKDFLRVCRESHDSVCCPENHVAVVVRNGLTFCQKRPFVCGPGQYVNTTTQACLSCQNGTYTYESDHTHTSCASCTALTGDPTFHSVIVQECNSTSPTVFGCKTGYFRNILQDPLTVDVKCSPCRQCDRKISHCDMYHDATCYDDDVMATETVVVLKLASEDKVQGYTQVRTATPTMTTCGHGFYLHINISDGVTSCQSCDDLQPEDFSHTRTLNQTFPDQTSVCQTQIQKFQIYSIILFILAVLVDILFIFLYSRHFLKKTSNFLRRNPTKRSDKMSHVFGTFAMDVHFILTFMHLFGILCEAGVVIMDGDILWTFTIAVIVTSLLVYFSDVAVFLYVKKIISFPACFHRTDKNKQYHIASSGNGDDGDDDNLTIIESEVI